MRRTAYHHYSAKVKECCTIHHTYANSGSNSFLFLIDHPSSKHVKEWVRGMRIHLGLRAYIYIYIDPGWDVNVLHVFFVVVVLCKKWTSLKLYSENIRYRPLIYTVFQMECHASGTFTIQCSRFLLSFFLFFCCCKYQDDGVQQWVSQSVQSPAILSFDDAFEKQRSKITSINSRYWCNLCPATGKYFYTVFYFDLFVFFLFDLERFYS